MAVIEELIRVESNGGISFGNYQLTTKTKKQGFVVEGDIYKVKTFNEITKLEKNDQFVYESVPGTAVMDFQTYEDGVTFSVDGNQDANVTLELEESAEYGIYINGEKVSEMATNVGGKLSVSVELDEGTPVKVKVVKL